MKRNIRRVLIGLACAAAALVLVGVQKYYPKYRDFREQTNYRFAIPLQDFFYQAGEADCYPISFLIRTFRISRLDRSTFERWRSLRHRETVSAGRCCEVSIWNVLSLF